MNTNFALITGAITGLGLALSKELAHRGYSLLLASLPGENLKEVTTTIRKKSNVEVIYFETDLTEQKNIIDLCKLVYGFPHLILVWRNCLALVIRV